MARATPIDKLSNRLSPIWGDTIYQSGGGTDEDISRLFIIYIGLDANRRLFIRQLYHDYQTNDMATERAEKERDAVVRGAIGESAPDGFLPPTPGVKSPYPTVFQRGYEAVHFGAKPCHVSIILTDFAQFHPKGNLPVGNEIEETIVFRKDKIGILNGRLRPIGYLSNDTFYDFEREIDFEQCDVIRFTNYATYLEDDPANTGNKKPRSYCMDIYIALPFDSKTPMFDSLYLDETKARTFDVDPPTKWLTMVFDPPQTNGGGEGPP